MRPKPVLHETEANYRDTETDTDTENVVSHPWLLLGSKLLGHLLKSGFGGSKGGVN